MSAVRENRLVLNLLGEMKISRNGEPIHFRSQKEPALLVYLAQTGQTISREAAADLLWESRTTEQSLSNLRTALTRIRKSAGDALAADRKTLAYDPAGRRYVDSVRLHQELAELKEIDSEVAAARLNNALLRYRGDFLAGFYLPDAPRFNDWVVITQERLRKDLFAGYQRLLDRAIAQGDDGLAIETANRWLAWDELNEPVYQRLIRLLARGGRTAAALAQCERLAERLAAELGVAPQRVTTALCEQIRSGQFEAVPIEKTVRRQVNHNLPRELTPFIGRETEIDEITHRTLDPAYPLITLTGEGGIGKTRLSVALARRLLETDEHPYLDGIWFVSLAEAAGPEKRPDPAALREEVATAIGSAVGMVFHGQRPPSRQLLAFLKEKTALLVLDNFETLVSGGTIDPHSIDLVIEMLETAPGLQLIVTSRTALDLNSEWVVRLDGLPVPEEAPTDLETPGKPGLLQPDAEGYDSVRLFAERAGRTSGDFRLGEQLAEVVAICRLVEGLPLAIELAAASARSLTGAEIAARLEENFEILSTGRRDVPARQRSMRAVFRYSWQLLDAEEQGALAQLSVFRGTFSRESAEAVLSGPVHRLDGLERHSLLRQDQDGRYGLHPLLREFAGEELAGMGADGALERHGHHYLNAVGEFTPAGRQLPGRMAAVQVDLDNIRQAWRWASDRPDLRALGAGCWGLATFYFRLALHREAEEMFRRAVGRLQAAGDGSDEAVLLLANLRAALAIFLNALHGYNEAIDMAREVLGFIEASRDRFELLDGLQSRGELALGTALYRQGHFEEALLHLDAGMEAARRAGLPGVEAAIGRRIGATLLDQGKYAEARTRFETALEVFRETGDRSGEGSALTDLGWLSHREQKLDEAMAYDQQAYETQLEAGNRHGAGIALVNKAIVHEMLGDFSEAYDCRMQVIRFLRDLDDRYHRSLVYHGLGMQLSRVGEYKAARDYYERSLAIDRELGDAAGVAWASNNLGLLYNHLGEYETALATHLEALETGRQIGARAGEGLSQLRVGQDLFGLGRFEEAETAYEQAVEILAELHRAVWALEARAGLAWVKAELGDPEAARAEIEPVLAHLAKDSLIGAREPLLIFWNAYWVLRACGDERAGAVLKTAEGLIQEQAARIRDADQRHSFLGIKVHREILAENDALKEKGDLT